MIGSMLWLAATLAQDEAAGGAEDLAKKLSNPVASLISVPFQFNWDGNYGPDDEGDKSFVNVQPVIPITLSEDWNLISRTIVPLVLRQDDLAGDSDDQSGLGDVVQSLFLSPSAPVAGLIVGVGPVILVPTATDDFLGADQWGAGPTAVVLKQIDGWTVGALANHIWSFAGDDDRRKISTTFLQPFVSYTTKTAWTFTANSEMTYDWKSEDSAVPINLIVSKLERIGGMPVSVGVGARYWLESADNGPEGWGFRLAVTFLFPK